MIGAIVGDIAGSRFEWDNIKSKEFELLTYRCKVTDDSVMSLAVAKAVLDAKGDYSNLGTLAVNSMREIGRQYPNCGYGGMFEKWMFGDSPAPYNSFGNGAAMRVSACGFAAKSLEEAVALSRKVTEVTHNHPEGIKGAEATAVCIFLAREGKNILEIRDYVDKRYYPMNFTLAAIRDSYRFDETCQGSVPQAIMAFLESVSFEDAIRNAVSIGGDSDTIAAIAGGIAEGYYGVPKDIRKHALTFLDERLLKILNEFESIYPPNLEKSISGKSVKVSGSKRKSTDGSREEVMRSSLLAADEDYDSSLTAAREETTAKALFNHLFAACNILRGPINQDEYKNYVTPILFFKRLSDVYDEETARALEESGGDEEFAAFPENHSFIIPEGSHWRDVRNSHENIGKAIVDAMMGIERVNPDTLAGVFSSFDEANWTDKAKLSDERLKNLVEHISKIKVGNENYTADVMGDAYEYLIKKFADLSKKNAGEFYTPRSIVRLLVLLLAPKSGETVCDPACGTGGMLIEAIRYIHNDKGTYGKIYGQEKNLSTSAIARMNLFLHGARDFKVVQGDTLRNPSFLHQGKLQTFDCVIANPPFSLEMWGAEAFASDVYGRNLWGSPTDKNADFAWLQHMVKSMSKEGRLAVVLPQGVLFRGSKGGEIRKAMIESDKLEYVIALASGIFYSTGVSACILALNNNKPVSRRGKVCLVDASGIYTPQRAQNIMTHDNVEEVFNLCSNYTDVSEKAKIATLEDIRSKDYTLSVSSYIDKAALTALSPSKVRERFFAALEEARLAEDSFKTLLKEGGYIDE